MGKEWWKETPEEFVAGFSEESQVHHSNPLLSESEQVYTLVPSTNSGRYALDDAQYGRDLSSGSAIAILLNGQWIEGRVEYASELYVNMGMQYLGEPPRLPKVIDGYYFIARNGGICGLCSGMKVKLL